MPLVNLYPFKNHPVKGLDDEYMKELAESIKEKGVLSPAIVIIFLVTRFLVTMLLLLVLHFSSRLPYLCNVTCQRLWSPLYV